MLPGRSVGLLLRRPGLWPTALVVARRLAPRRWWRRPTRLPLPDAGYMAFRMETAYGDAAHPPEPTDLVEYLEWCRRQPRRRPARGRGRYRVD